MTGMGFYEEVLKSFYIKDANEYWKDYRKKLTDLLLERYEVFQPEKKSKLSLLILGGGYSNDIDLERLKDKYEITIMDIDKNAEEFYQKKGGINYIRDSFTCVGEKEHKKFYGDMLDFLRISPQRVDFVTFDKIALIMLDDKNWEMRVTDKIPESDIIIAAGLHSQLFTLFPYLYEIIAENLYDKGLLDTREEKLAKLYEDSCFMERIRNKNERFIPKFNEEIFIKARKNAIFSLETGGVEGACEAIEDIETTYKDKIVSRKQLEWNFNPKDNKKYDMAVYVLDTVKRL